jgi:hypothetical protein
MSTLTLNAAPILPLATVPAADLQRGDLIGGTSGEWLTVSSVYVDPNVRHLVAEVEVAPMGDPEHQRTWQIDALARIAILRPEAGVR